jgi:hypothetical protein
MSGKRWSLIASVTAGTTSRRRAVRLLVGVVAGTWFAAWRRERLNGQVAHASVDDPGGPMRQEPVVERFQTPSGDRVVDVADIRYAGAFRLPDVGERPLTFAYGGNAMTFRPGETPDDAHLPGSLFITGHERIPFDVPDGSQVAEVSIPAPSLSRTLPELPVASIVQPFHDVTGGLFDELDEIPKIGMQYLDHPDTGPLIHLAWGEHLQPQDVPSHAWFGPDLEAPETQGAWFIGNQNLYSVNGYMFEIPAEWPDAHTGGRSPATGRMRDGGQGGMGPALFAYRPWQDDGAPPPAGTRLEEVTLLRYESADSTPDIERCLDGYQHADEWEGGAWLTTPSGKGAVLLAGTKATGEQYWYGYLNPAGPEEPCVDSAFTDFPTCRLADGTPCPAEDMAGCCDGPAGECISERGWWSSRFDAQFILYDPAELERVAAGEMEPWEPQPYAALDIDEHLFLNPPGWDEASVGWGDQRQYRIGDVAFDRDHGYLYVLELFADEGKPVVHVWELAE